MWGPSTCSLYINVEELLVPLLCLQYVRHYASLCSVTDGQSGSCSLHVAPGFSWAGFLSMLGVSCRSGCVGRHPFSPIMVILSLHVVSRPCSVRSFVVLFDIPHLDCSRHRRRVCSLCCCSALSVGYSHVFRSHSDHLDSVGEHIPVPSSSGSSAASSFLEADW